MRNKKTRYIVEMGTSGVCEVLASSPEGALGAAGLFPSRQTKKGSIGGNVLSWSGHSVPQKPSGSAPWRVYVKASWSSSLSHRILRNLVAVFYSQGEIGGTEPSTRAAAELQDWQKSIAAAGSPAKNLSNKVEPGWKISWDVPQVELPIQIVSGLASPLGAEIGEAMGGTEVPSVPGGSRVALLEGPFREDRSSTTELTCWRVKVLDCPSKPEMVGKIGFYHVTSSEFGAATPYTPKEEPATDPKPPEAAPPVQEAQPDYTRGRDAVLATSETYYLVAAPDDEHASAQCLLVRAGSAMEAARHLGCGIQYTQLKKRSHCQQQDANVLAINSRLAKLNRPSSSQPWSIWRISLTQAHLCLNHLESVRSDLVSTSLKPDLVLTDHLDAYADIPSDQRVWIIQTGLSRDDGWGTFAVQAPNYEEAVAVLGLTGSKFVGFDPGISSWIRSSQFPEKVLSRKTAGTVLPPSKKCPWTSFLTSRSAFDNSGRMSSHMHPQFVAAGAACVTEDGSNLTSIELESEIVAKMKAAEQEARDKASAAALPPGHTSATLSNSDYWLIRVRSAAGEYNWFTFENPDFQFCLSRLGLSPSGVFTPPCSAFAVEARFRWRGYIPVAPTSEHPWIAYRVSQDTIKQYGVSRQQEAFQALADLGFRHLAVTHSTPLPISTDTGATTMAITDPKPTKFQNIVATAKIDANDAAWRVAGSQLVKLVREPVCAALCRHLGPNDDSLRVKIAAFLETDIGTAMLSAILSLALSQMTIAGSDIPEKLSRELRISAMADGADVVADLLMGPLKQVITSYLQGTPLPVQIAEDPKELPEPTNTITHSISFAEAVNGQPKP